MKTAVITGSTRGLGFEMAKSFRRYGWNVVLNGTNEQRLEAAKAELGKTEGTGEIDGFRASVTSPDELLSLADRAKERFGAVDIWINNAGINQPMKAIWELTCDEINSLIDVDLRGAVIGSGIAVRLMQGQPGGGFIYNTEGYGSNDAMMLGFNMYGTSKRAVTHFTVALAKELEERQPAVKAGRLSPGVVITDFLTHALDGEQKIILPEKTQRFYNIMADYPDEVAGFLVKSMIGNRKNNAHIQWLTFPKIAARFITSGSRKRDLFKDRNGD
ncbi:MAG: SDR family oxidoreductase [Ruminiclostridium sp.]|nr:SDR family oxidoreductase [Ruminiclostridium sp.]